MPVKVGLLLLVVRGLTVTDGATVSMINAPVPAVVLLLPALSTAVTWTLYVFVGQGGGYGRAPRRAADRCRQVLPADGHRHAGDLAAAAASLTVPVKVGLFVFVVKELTVSVGADRVDHDVLAGKLVVRAARGRQRQNGGGCPPPARWCRR